MNSFPKLSTSNILFVFSKPLLPSQILFINKEISFSTQTINALTLNWEAQLKKKRDQLLQKDIFSEIRTYPNENKVLLNALYVNEKPVMWPGNAITLRNWVVEDDKAQLTVSAISYPFISALNDFRFLDAIESPIETFLRPALAICTFAITSDGFIVLTKRGDFTNVYPGRLYGQGGNPSEIDFDLLSHQVTEMEEEIMTYPIEVATDSLRFGGVIEDLETFPGKPDLVGWVNISLSSGEVKKRIEDRPPNDRPGDVSSVLFIHLNETSFSNFLKQHNSSEFCPPAHGGLLLMGFFRFGEKWFHKMVKELN